MTRPATITTDEDYCFAVEAKLSKHTLVLNKTFLPIQTTTVRHALELLFQERAKVVDDSYLMYSLDEWMVQSALVLKQTTVPNSELVLAISGGILIPKVICLIDYETIPKKTVRFRRRDVFVRDNYKCQYCNKLCELSKLTIDHILPRSRGGITSWDNCVTSCRPCNTIKADRTPEEAGMPLLSVPKKPNAIASFSKRIENNPAWTKFI